MSEKNEPIGQLPSPAPKKSTLREYTEAFLVAFLIAMSLRGFVFEAFRIPSRSLVPTLLVGDHLFVNKLAYGIRVPFTKKWITQFQTPKRGEVVVFVYPDRDPRKEEVDYIKRVVGVPGDQISLIGNNLFVNGEKIEEIPLTPKGIDPNHPQKILMKGPPGVALNNRFGSLPLTPEWQGYDYFVERLNSVDHWVQRRTGASYRPYEKRVPEGYLLVMGDNRDDSSDSREWGFVPMENLIGRAMFIWLSPDIRSDYSTYDPFLKKVKIFFKQCEEFFVNMRWYRFGQWIR